MGTRERLLDSAEELYSERGIDATSLRAITAHAGANLAAVHYHFGSKDALTEAVLRRRIEPLNAQRLERLAAYETNAAGGTLSVEPILEALVVPALALRRDPQRGGEAFVRLLGRIYSEPSAQLQKVAHGCFQELFRRFTQALARAVPELKHEELLWRLHFAVGAMIHAIADPAQIHRMTAGVCDPHDHTRLAAVLVRFLASGFRAPPFLTADVAPTEAGSRVVSQEEGKR